MYALELDFEIKPFNGKNIEEYEYWAELIHARIILNRNLGPEVKQLAVLNCLEDSAKEVVQCLKPRGLYNLVQTLEILDKEYGNPTVLKGAMFRRLRNLPPLDLTDISTLCQAKVLVQNLLANYRRFGSKSSNSKMEEDSILSLLSYNQNAQMSLDSHLAFQDIWDPKVSDWMKWCDTKIFQSRRHAYDSELAKGWKLKVQGADKSPKEKDLDSKYA